MASATHSHSAGTELELLLACDRSLGLFATPHVSDEPKLAIYAARQPDGRGPTGHGIDPDDGQARLKALAEALERACLRLPSGAELQPLPFGAVEDQLDPLELWGGAPEDAPAQLRETPRLWTRAECVSDQRRVLLPAEAIYLDAARHTAAPIRAESISSGAALGVANSGQAFERALFETIERDAYVNAWFGEAPPARISEPFTGLEGLFAELRRYRLESRVFDLGRQLGPPAALAIALDRSGAGPAVTAGIAARATYRQAIRSALLESIGCRRGIRVAMARGSWPEPGPAERINSIKTRAAFWTPLASLALLPGWVENGPTRTYESLDHTPASAAAALAELNRRGLAVYRRELTLPSIAENGFEVVRVVVPRLLPLHIAERAAPRASWRGLLRVRPELPPHPFV